MILIRNNLEKYTISRIEFAKLYYMLKHKNERKRESMLTKI